MNTKTILIVLGIIGILFIGCLLSIKSLFGDFDKEYSKEELIEHYETHENEFQALIDYFNQIVPEGREIDIEFKNDKKLFNFGVIDSSNKKPIYFEFDVKINRDIPKDILTAINWDESTFRELKKRLDAVNCIQIASGDLTQIGFQRSGLGMYSYHIFEGADTSELNQLKQYRPDLTFFEDNVAWSYNGGAAD